MRSTNRVFWVIANWNAGQEVIIDYLKYRGLVEDNSAFQSVVDEIAPFGFVPKVRCKLPENHQSMIKAFNKAVQVWRETCVKTDVIVSVPALAARLLRISKVQVADNDVVLHWHRDALTILDDVLKSDAGENLFGNIRRMSCMYYLQDIETLTTRWLDKCGGDITTLSGNAMVCENGIDTTTGQQCGDYQEKILAWIDSIT